MYKHTTNDAHECIVGEQQRSLLHDMGSSSKHNEQVQCVCVMIITVTLISRDQTQFPISVCDMDIMDELINESRANECTDVGREREHNCVSLVAPPPPNPGVSGTVGTPEQHRAKGIAPAGNQMEHFGSRFGMLGTRATGRKVAAMSAGT